MAILGKIQRKSGVLIGIIALALFAFIIQGLIKNSSRIGKGNSSIVAEVGDRTVSTQDFQKRVALLQKQNKSLSNMQAVNMVWDQVIREAVLNNQFDKLGINVGMDRIHDLLVNNPSIKKAFTNKQGIFDENALLDYIQSMEDAKNTNPEQYAAWKNFENSLLEQEKEKIYMDLIKATANTTLKEGEWLYHFENDAVDFNYAAVAYSTIPDSTITITKEEISSYVSKHPKIYKSEESRDMEYVYIPIEASKEDIKNIKEDLTKLIEDKEIFDEKTSKNIVKKGLKNTDNPEEFVAENTDMNMPARYFFKNDLDKKYADTIIKLNKGDIFGPYEIKKQVYLSRILETKMIPDSAKAAHILIAYKGALRANPSVKRTKEEAKKKADSLLRVIRRSPSKFSDFAKKFSDGPTKTKGGDLGWFTYGRMVPEFNDFIFAGSKGKIGLVKTDFGYHIIKINDLTKPEKAIKMISIIKNVLPSVKTEDEVFAKASKLTSLAIQAKDFNNFAKENNLKVKPVRKLGRYEDKIPGLETNREIVKWLFKKDTKVGDINKFNLKKGYVIVRMTGIHEKGLMSPEEASSLVKPILMKEKKADIIKKKMTGKTLQEISKNSSARIGKATRVTLKNPIIPGYGKESKVVATAFVSAKDKISEPISGNKAVFVVKTIKVNIASDVKNYFPFAEKIKKEENSGINNRVIEALKKANKIEDKRSNIY